MEVCEDTVETYPPRTLYTVSVLHDIQRHLKNCNQGNVVKFMGGLDNSYLDSCFIKGHPY